MIFLLLHVHNKLIDEIKKGLQQYKVSQIENGREWVNRYVREVPDLSSRKHASASNLLPKLQNFPGCNLKTWFQQDGSSTHMTQPPY